MRFGGGGWHDGDGVGWVAVAAARGRCGCGDGPCGTYDKKCRPAGATNVTSWMTSGQSWHHCEHPSAPCYGCLPSKPVMRVT